MHLSVCMHGDLRHQEGTGARFELGLGDRLNLLEPGCTAAADGAGGGLADSTGTPRSTSARPGGGKNPVVPATTLGAGGAAKTDAKTDAAGEPAADESSGSDSGSTGAVVAIVVVVVVLLCGVIALAGAGLWRKKSRVRPPTARRTALRPTPTPAPTPTPTHMTMPKP